MIRGLSITKQSRGNDSSLSGSPDINIRKIRQPTDSSKMGMMGNSPTNKRTNNSKMENRSNDNFTTTM